MGDYAEFSEASPGPGMRKETTALRHVTFEPVAGVSGIAIEHEMQNAAVAALKKRAEELKRVAKFAYGFAVVMVIVIALTFLTKLVRC